MAVKKAEVYAAKSDTEESILVSIISEVDENFYQDLAEFKADLPDVEPCKFVVELSVRKVGLGVEGLKDENN